MTKRPVVDTDKLLRRRATRRRWIGVCIAAAFFVLGYNAMTAQTQSCQAQYSPTPPIPAFSLVPVLPSACGCAGANTVPCSMLGSTAVLTTSVGAAYYEALRVSAIAVENYIGTVAVDSLVQAVFSRLDQAEKDLAAWFDTYWYYNYKPSLQAMTEQANVSEMDQAQQIAAFTDAEKNTMAALEIQGEDAKSAVAMSEVAGDESCAVATAAGGLGSATVYARAMRRAWQNEYVGEALNRKGTPSARGAAALVAAHAQEFENLSCNPADNGGRNTCGASDPQFYNADVQVTSRVFNALTIPMDKDQRHAEAVKMIIDNMIGRPLANPLKEEQLQTAAGKEVWMERRPYIARMNAARATPGLIASWRVPGGATGSGSFVAALREGAGVTVATASDNPSYREVMHAMAVDRFNSGSYALDKIGSGERQQMEKLVLDALYLMQLRDYYELLERTALSLAVQTAVLADQQPMPDLSNIRPASKQATPAGGTP